jgi:threonine aldolase
MLGAIIRCSLRDDIYQEDVSTTSFESHIATLTGFSGAAFVLSGTMANQLALRTHLTQPPHAILADARSHILHWEAGGIASLCGAMVQSVQASNGEYLTLADIQRKVVLSDDVHKCPTSVISLENTIGGIIQPLEETRKISTWARENGLKMHLDGARLFEVVAAG